LRFWRFFNPRGIKIKKVCQLEEKHKKRLKPLWLLIAWPHDLNPWFVSLAEWLNSHSLSECQ
jgi:hypothetical protein